MKQKSFTNGVIIAIFGSLMQLWVIYKAPIIYIPILFTLLFSFYYGIISPRKGWILALIQVSIIIGGYWLGQRLGIQANKAQEAEFVSHIIIFPSFVASLLSAFVFKKT